MIKRVLSMVIFAPVSTNNGTLRFCILADTNNPSSVAELPTAISLIVGLSHGKVDVWPATSTELSFPGFAPYQNW